MSETKWVRIEGFREEITDYEFEIKEANYNGEDLTVDFLNVRHQDSAIMEDCEYKLYAGEDLIDETSSSPGGYDNNTTTLSGNADPGDNWKLEFYSPQWHDSAVNIDNWDGYVTFEGEVPELNMEVLEVTPSKDFPASNEDWEVSAKIGNNSQFEVKDKEINVEVSGMDRIKTGTVKITIGKTSTKTMELGKEEIRKILGVDEIKRGGYTICFEV